jgi:hypothetical protein
MLPAAFGKPSLCLQHGVRDPGIGTAPAEISAHAFAHTLGIVAGLTFPDQADRDHDLAWRAEPALKAVMCDEGGLDGMERVTLRQAFDRQDMRAVVTDRESKTRIDASPIDEDRTCAALSAVAALLGPGQVEAFAQEIEERDPRVVQCDLPRHAVHGKRN